jgi:hypothetical protein
VPLKTHELDVWRSEPMQGGGDADGEDVRPSGGGSLEVWEYSMPKADLEGMVLLTTCPDLSDACQAFRAFGAFGAFGAFAGGVNLSNFGSIELQHEQQTESLPN